MPVYEFVCHDCQDKFERILSIAKRKTPQQCPECHSGNTEKIISQVGVVLRGDGWPSKALKINRQMAAKNRRLAKRQEERKRDGPGVKLAPNVGGERVDSWTEAQKLAQSKGLDSESYEPLVSKENAA
jgi:putative FmdB family regulatory protein